jgi:Uma2 family endonuclease
MLDMITPNRLDSVISKIGQVTKKDFGKLIAGLAEDVIETYNRENGLKYINLEKNEKKLITKKLSPELVRTVTEYFADLE